MPPTHALADAASRFPALSRTVGGRPAAYLDGPGGTQVPGEVTAAIRSVLDQGTSNLGGPFAASDAARVIVEDARAAVADLAGADAGGVVFGQNMTSLTFAASRAIARTFEKGDAIAVTSLDHDANVAPWKAAAADRGLEVHTIEFDPVDGTLDMDDLDRILGLGVRLLAVTAASNALGTVTPLPEIVFRAHAAGALVYVDAVHHAAHRRIDTAAVPADFVAMSAYKFFGPHTGMLVARPELLARIAPYKVRPAPATPPDSWETGTQSFESLAGVTAAIDYLASYGDGETRAARLADAFGAIEAHERALSERFLAGCAEMPSIGVEGVSDPARVQERVATFALSVDGKTPAEVATRLGDRGVFVWHGNYYAVSVMERLGFEGRGGLVRVGFVHYNTLEEVDRVLEELDRL